MTCMFISELFILKHLLTITKVGTSLHALNKKSFEVIFFSSLQITFILFSRTNRWGFFSQTSTYWKLQRQRCILIKT